MHWVMLWHSWLTQFDLYNGCCSVVTSHSFHMRSIVMSLSVCLSVRSHNSKITWPNFTTFLCMFPMAVTRSSSDGVVLCYVFPVLWMKSCFISGSSKHYSRVSNDILFSNKDEQVLVVGCTSGVKFAVYDWLPCFLVFSLHWMSERGVCRPWLRAHLISTMNYGASLQCVQLLSMHQIGQWVVSVTLCVPVTVRLLKGKWLELTTPNLVHLLYGSHWTCVDPEVRRSEVKVTWLRKPSRSHGC